MRMEGFSSETPGDCLRHRFIVSEIRYNILEHIPGVLNRIFSMYTSALGFGRRKEKPAVTLSLLDLESIITSLIIVSI